MTFFISAPLKLLSNDSIFIHWKKIKETITSFSRKKFIYNLEK